MFGLHWIKREKNWISNCKNFNSFLSWFLCYKHTKEYVPTTPLQIQNSKIYTTHICNNPIRKSCVVCTTWWDNLTKENQTRWIGISGMPAPKGKGRTRTIIRIFQEQTHGVKKDLRKFTIKTEHQPKSPQLDKESFILYYTIEHLWTFSMIIENHGTQSTYCWKLRE